MHRKQEDSVAKKRFIFLSLAFVLREFGLLCDEKTREQSPEEGAQLYNDKIQINDIER
jgi:hypothetical protein